MEADDFLMLFTDGLFEVEAPDHELYSSERLITAVRQRAGLKSDELFDQLFAEIRQFSNRTEFTDDVCLLGMDVTGSVKIDLKSPMMTKRGSLRLTG
jgi:serine phosphatase RsbU (regulator of sigma subunit)